MADTTFTAGTLITSSWLNDVNDAVYNGADFSGITAINIKDPAYGAVGDGITDDTTAIQAAINAAQTSTRSLYVPAGKYKTTATLTVTTPIKITGDGFDISAETGSVIYGTHTSGVILEFNNTAGSFDNGLLLSNILFLGNGLGSTVGVQLEGVVWPTSVIQAIGIKSTGGAGLRVVDCISANIAFCRVQQCAGGGYSIDQSNAIKFFGCSAESNGTHGWSFSNAGTVGERVGCELICCLSEENTGDALRLNQQESFSVHGGYYQVAAASSVDYAAIRLISSNHCSIIGAKLRTNQPFALFSGINLDGATHTKVIGCSFVKVSGSDGFDTNRDIVENSTSNRNMFVNNTGGGAQGEASYTTTSTIGSYYTNHAGTASDYGMEQWAGYHTLRSKDGTVVLANFHPTNGVLLGQSGGKLGFFGTSPVTKATVSGSRGGNAALQSLLTALANYGIIVDSSS